ncbi:glycoside-pentoside-hexuronide (GPH):cation symporter [Thermoanaerobacterium butyriciformans]|uniref:GPH family glycoside/pentoside/hexuronide:cation symporter n=1 Tax=Thermoanaerobacterium butyriciformans TaxID=1702242 RepID=A0ABS4NBM5_9THEO|nr:glycoside-pentoside-hexuronide (GPH):cation symporter [Thermoanaerobacterium butyriciformans]MBP2071076.1 GPH family glycoside/pentoside/hexuronide:cation symporter [Thermoanaerobacterium butyriciformans]
MKIFETTWKERISYGLSDTASNLVYQMITTYLMFFYTDVFGISAAAVGTLFLVARIIDAFDGPFFGILIDHTNTKWGKCRPYFLWLSIPYGVLAILAFTTPSFNASGKLVYAYVTYILLGIIYSGINIPITSILPSLTDNLEERNILVSTRMILATVGATIVSVGTLPLVKVFGNGNQQKGFMMTMTLFAVLAVILFLVTFFNTREKVNEAKEQSITLKEELKALKGNTPWFILFFVAFINFIAFIMKAQTTVYYLTYNLKMPNLISVALGLGSLNVVSLLIMPFLAKKIGKRNVMITGFTLSILAQFILYLSSLTSSAFIFLIGTVIAAFGNGFVMGAMFSMTADTVDYGEWKSGVRAQGLLSATPAFGVKAGMGIGGALAGWILSIGKYVPDHTQTVSALKAIEINFIWLPLIGFAIGAILLLFYNLDKQQEQMTKELNERRAKVSA